MTALCLHAATLEEARRIIREAVEVCGAPGTPENMERWKRLAPELNALGRNDKESVLTVHCEILAEKFDDLNSKQFEYITAKFYHLDGTDVASYGNQEALDWARRAVREKKGGLAANYLNVKGDARDLDILPYYFKENLAARVAGTNVVVLDDHQPGIYIYPSVTNTGPQGAYVHKIIHQSWMNLKEETRTVHGNSFPCRDPAKIPVELLTMRVWFDADGKPVCNVDLSKYGLSMPELDAPNKPNGGLGETCPTNPPQEGAFGRAVSPKPPQEVPPTTRLWPYALLALIILALGGLYAKRRK